MLGQPLVADEHVGIRVFSAPNVDRADLDHQAADTGQLVRGPAHFKPVYEKLWGRRLTCPWQKESP